MKDNAVSTRTRELRAAVDSLHATLRERLPEPEAPQFAPPLHRLPALRIAVTLCRDVEARDGLAKHFRRVPDEYIDKGLVTCLCGSSLPVGDLAECPGGCGRWFAGDESGVFAVRLDVAA